MASVDQAHKPAFAEAERTIGCRGRHAERKTWDWIFHAVAVGKSEDLHRRIARSWLDKALREGKTIDSIKEVRCDLETGLWKALVDEINAAKSDGRIAR